MDSVQNEVGNVGNENLGFCEARFEEILPLGVGFEDSDGAKNEVVDARSEVGRRKGGGFGAVSGFYSRKDGLRHWILEGAKVMKKVTRKSVKVSINVVFICEIKCYV